MDFNTPGYKAIVPVVAVVAVQVAEIFTTATAKKPHISTGLAVLWQWWQYSVSQ
jgi:hypothetical protein